MADLAQRMGEIRELIEPVPLYVGHGARVREYAPTQKEWEASEAALRLWREQN